MAAASGGAAVALGMSPVAAASGAALAAVVRVVAGDSPAALTGAVLAPLLAIASLASTGGATVHALIALAAAGWAIAELARPADEAMSPLAAVPAAVAGILDPSYAALLAIAGLRIAREPRPVGAPPERLRSNLDPYRRDRRSSSGEADRQSGGIEGFPRSARWRLALPVAGAIGVALAGLAATVWPALGARWFGAPAHAISPAALATAIAEALGPITAVAAIAGLASLARPRHAELAIAAALAGAIGVDLRAATVGPATIGLAALLAGLATGRLAATIRLASGQAITGAALAALALVPPAWTAVAQRAPAAHIGRASR
jgi:hypothetical protein